MVRNLVRMLLQDLALSMRGNGSMANHMELDNYFSMMAPITMAHSTKDLSMEMVDLFQPPSSTMKVKSEGMWHRGRVYA